MDHVRIITVRQFCLSCCEPKFANAADQNCITPTRFLTEAVIVLTVILIMIDYSLKPNSLTKRKVTCSRNLQGSNQEFILWEFFPPFPSFPFSLPSLPLFPFCFLSLHHKMACLNPANGNLTQSFYVLMIC